jgi:hypothetical protein
VVHYQFSERQRSELCGPTYVAKVVSTEAEALRDIVEAIKIVDGKAAAGDEYGMAYGLEIVLAR